MTALTDDKDHNYLASENDANNSNVIYVVDPNVKIESIEPSNDASATFLVCNSNFNDLTIMDVGAVQTIDQDAHLN